MHREELKGMIMESVRVLVWFCITALFSNGACIAKEINTEISKDCVCASFSVLVSRLL